ALPHHLHRESHRLGDLGCPLAAHPVKLRHCCSRPLLPLKGHPVPSLSGPHGSCSVAVSGLPRILATLSGQRASGDLQVPLPWTAAPRSGPRLDRSPRSSQPRAGGASASDRREPGTV